MKRNFLRPGAYATAGAAAAVLAVSAGGVSVAQAQEVTDDEATQTVEEIVVTGSRIRRDDFTSSTPMTVLSGQAILDQGLQNLGEALRDQAALGTGGFNQSSVLSGGGATSVDLRNLGQSRVLVLINGRRVANFADALANEAADLTFIPTAMVERVEILRDGASAVYGSDAITGVINVILKKDFEGVEATVSTGASGEGDGENYGFSLTMGTSTDRGNFVAGAEYRRQDPIKQIDRDWAFPSISALSSAGATNGSFFSPGGAFFGNGGAFLCTVPKAFGGDEVTFVPPGECPSNLSNQQVTSPDQVELLRYDYALQQDLIIKSEVYATSLFGNYQLTDDVNVFLESQFSKRQGTSSLDGNPGSFGTPTFPAGSFVPESNPNNPTGEDGFYYFRPTSTIGARITDQESNTIRLVAGVDGDIPMLEDWFYEGSVLYTRVDADLITNSTWNLARFIRISDPDLCAADSQCAQVVNPSGALDTFRPGNWTDAEIQYMRQNSGAISKFETVGWQAFVSGPVVELPAGPLSVALGLESRTDKGFNKPDSITEAGESVANQVFTTEGESEVDEIFAEFDIPIVGGLPFAEDVTLNLQYRVSDYDAFGTEDVYRVGLDWQVLPSVRVRANTSTAYRAPQVTDLFGGGTVSFDFFTPDICDASASGIQPGSNAYINCNADLGVNFTPDTFSQPSSQYPVLSGSNPNLDPETADTHTLGIVFTPQGDGPLGFLEGLQFSADMWSVSVDNLISRNTSESVLSDCYEGPVGLTAPECDQFDGRNPNTGVPFNFVNQLSNLDNVRTNGTDVGIQYGFDGPADTLINLSLNGTYVNKNTFYPNAGGADDRGSIPRIKGNLRADVLYGDWTVSWSMQYISGMDDPDFDGDNVFGYDTVPSYDNHDLRVAYNWNQYRFLVGINNVFDEDPPYVFSSGNNTDTFLYDVFGRYWFARVSYAL